MLIQLIQDNEGSLEPEFIGEMYWWPEFKEEMSNLDDKLTEEAEAALFPVTLKKDPSHVFNVAHSGTCC